jgi:hypothetical protein
MIFMQNNNTYANQSDKRKKSQQKATAIFNKKNYKNISIRVKPDQADEIRATAEKLQLSLAQLIVNAVRLYADIQTAGADPTQPEHDPTKSPMKSGKTAEQEPEEETEEETEENQTAGAETTAGAEEEPQEDEDEDEKPEDIPSFVWEQIQRLKKADKRQTAERKAREAAERKRRRLGEESAEDY